MFFLLFWLFLSEILSRRCRLSRTTSDPAQKVEKIMPKLRFPVFPAKILARFCHAVLDFREHRGLPPEYFDHARSIAMADQNRRWRISRSFLANSFFEPTSNMDRQKKFFQKVRHLVLIYTPKEAHSRIFVTGGSVIAWQMLAKKNVFSGRPTCTSTSSGKLAWPRKAFFLATFFSI